MRTLLATLVAVVFSAQAWAGGTAVLNMEGGEQATLEYDGQKIRLTANLPGNGDGYLLVEGDKLYSVSMDGHQPVVVDLATMGSMMGAIAGASGQLPLEQLSGEDVRIGPASGTETVAGITGRVHELSYRDEKGQQQAWQVVLSDDPRAVELTRAFMHLSAVTAATFGQKIDSMDEFQQQLFADGRGLLRLGDEMRLVSLDETIPPAERFVLPAAPGALPDFGALMEQAMEQAPQMMEALNEMMKGMEGTR